MSKQANTNAINVNSSLMLPLGLALFVLISAITVVQIKHRTRILHDDSNRLTAAHDKLIVEWSQLQLEEAAYSNHARIDGKARKKLKMLEPQQPINISISAEQIKADNEAAAQRAKEAQELLQKKAAEVSKQKASNKKNDKKSSKKREQKNDRKGDRT